jgi:pectate lyase-like protein
MVTISNSFIHDHFKTSLIGHSDSNAAQDTGKLHVTYANNYWKNTNSRNPSIRFGTAHMYVHSLIVWSLGAILISGATTPAWPTRLPERKKTMFSY